MSGRFAFDGTHDGRVAGTEPMGTRASRSNIALVGLEHGEIADR